jgi:SnoaL-like domain
VGGGRAGDIAAATSVLDPQVRWYAAGDPNGEGACHNREQATAFIRRSVAEDVTAQLLDIHGAGRFVWPRFRRRGARAAGNRRYLRRRGGRPRRVAW